MTFNDKNQDKSQADGSMKHRWGSRFKAAREAMNLTEKDAAARLHLKPHLITIIETERFENGPPPIFMRGYIRSYARLLNLPEKEITQALAQLDLANPATSAPAAPTTRTRVSSANNNSSNTGWSTALVVIVLVGLVGMWWNNHSRNSLKDATETASLSSTQATVASTTPTPDAAPAIPADPTPKELVTQPTVATATLAPAPTAPNTAVAPTTANPVVNVAPAPKVDQAKVDQTAIQDQTATQEPTTEAENTNPASNAATSPAVTPDADDTQTAAAAIPETEADAKPVKSRTHVARARAADTASDEMAIPEQGLEPEDNNN
jgi:cytoskeleton protein RodZ